MNATVASQSPSNSLTRLFRRIVLVAVVSVAAVAGLVSPASADTVWGSAGAVETQLTCTTGSIVISPFVSVQNGYQNGQYVSYRYYLTNSYGYQGVSGWSSASYVAFAPTSWGRTTLYGTSMLPQARIPAAAGALWEVHVQVAYWNPNAYAYGYTGWYQPESTTTITPRYSRSGQYASCLT